MNSAILVRPLTPTNNPHSSWHKGSALYRVDPPVEVNYGGFLDETAYVIVAVTPETVDHGRKETTIFAACEDGGTYRPSDPEAPLMHCGLPEHFFEDCHRLHLDGGAELLAPEQRIVGRYDHAAALANLEGGYTIDE